MSLQANLKTWTCSEIFACFVLVQVHGGREQIGQGSRSFIDPISFLFLVVIGPWHNNSISGPYCTYHEKLYANLERVINIQLFYLSKRS